MLFVTLTALFTIYVLPVGRRLFALRRIRKTAKAMGHKRVVKAVEAAIAHDTATMDMENRRRAASSAMYGPVVQGHDTAVDATVVGIDKYLESQVQIYGEDSQRGKAAAHLRREVFPDGVRPIVKLSYVQEHEAVTWIVKRLESGDLADHVATLPDLADMIARLSRLNRIYGDALIEGKESVPGPQELRQAQAQGQELFLEVVAVIVAEFAGIEDKSARDELLEPVYEQHEAMRLARRRRRAGTDIDPDTGDELSSPDEPDSEPDSEPGDVLLRAD